MLKTVSTLLFITLISFNVCAISLIEISPVRFGTVAGEPGLSCAMSKFGDISGGCDATNPDISIGHVVITNLPRGGDLEIVIKGASSSSIRYTPVAELEGAKEGNVILYNDKPVYVSSKEDGADFTIKIYGNIAVQGDLHSSQPHTADYTIQVNQL